MSRSMEVAGKVCLAGLLDEAAGSVPEGGGSTQSLRVESIELWNIQGF